MFAAAALCDLLKGRAETILAEQTKELLRICF